MAKENKIKTLYRGSDIVIGLNFISACGCRIDNLADKLYSFTILFYTTNKSDNVIKTKDDIKYDTCNRPYLIINQNEYTSLDDGRLRYNYHFKLLDTDFSDGTYDKESEGYILLNIITPNNN